MLGTRLRRSLSRAYTYLDNNPYEDIKMGSFNASCFASQQVIAPGDACKVVTLIRRRTYSKVELSDGDKTFSVYGTTCSTCYPVAFWAPAVGFMDAVYDDCGQVTLVDTPTTRIRLLTWAAYMYRNALAVAEGENKCHDIPFDYKALLGKHCPALLEQLSKSHYFGRSQLLFLEAHPSFFDEVLPVWNAAWEVSQEHRLFSMDRSDEPSPMQYGLMHEATANYLVDYSNKMTDWSNEAYEQRTFFNRCVRSAKESAEGHAGKESVFWFVDALRREFERVGYYEGLGLISADLFNGLWALGPAYLEGSLSDDELFIQCKPFLDERYVLHGLLCLDLKFAPIVYAGQDYSNESGKAYAKFVNAVQKEVSRRRQVRNRE